MLKKIICLVAKCFRHCAAHKFSVLQLYKVWVKSIFLCILCFMLEHNTTIRTTMKIYISRPTCYLNLMSFFLSFFRLDDLFFSLALTFYLIKQKKLKLRKRKQCGKRRERESQVFFYFLAVNWPLKHVHIIHYRKFQLSWTNL